MEIFRTEDLTFTYPQKNIPTIKNISLSINEGDFITVCGPTGCGKSTLLKMLKKEITPLGRKEGKVYFLNNDIEKTDSKITAFQIGYVTQRPNQQIVTDKVWHELAFGLENMNVSPNIIRRRIAEIASFFGIEDWFEKSVNTLSGGQKQKLNLASVMVMNPKVLILDEPTSQLDPVSASEFIATLRKINKELGITIIIAEHRLEDLVSISDKLLIMKNGAISHYDSPKRIISTLEVKDEILLYMPIPSRFYCTIKAGGECPLSAREGRRYVEEIKNKLCYIPKSERFDKIINSNPVLELKNVYFKYEKNQKDILSNINFSVYENEIFCILGGNGSGKSTTLSVATGILKPYSGNVRLNGKKIKEYKPSSLYGNLVSYLPQDVQTLFSEDITEKEVGEGNPYTWIIKGYEELKNRHPYDLSGGEQQLVALAKILFKSPKILFLDEPTIGLDPGVKNNLLSILFELKNRGMTIIIVTHDVEFASICADRCAMLFRGQIVSHDKTNTFFSENSFYTTSANKITRGIFDGIVTYDDLLNLQKIKE